MLMLNLKKASLLAVVGVMLAPAAVFAADYTHRDVVKDARQNVILNTHGNCVHTKWQAASDECGGAMRYDVRNLAREQRTVYFDFNRSTLNAREKAKLDGLSQAIVASKQVESVDIVGFADQIGKPSYNKALSQKRAANVKAYLASKGLKTRNIRVEGMGESKPVTNCDDKMERNALIACLAEDRRVEIMLNLVK
jgi:outer membrane protein OmpA-like peptidoglycan-associated protein